MQKLIFICAFIFVFNVQSETVQCTSVFTDSLYVDRELRELALEAMDLSAKIADPVHSRAKRYQYKYQLNRTYSQIYYQSTIFDGGHGRLSGWLNPFLRHNKAPRPLFMRHEYYGEFHWTSTGIPHKGFRTRTPYLTHESREIKRVEMSEDGLIHSKTGTLVREYIDEIFVVGLDGEIYVN